MFKIESIDVRLSNIDAKINLDKNLTKILIIDYGSQFTQLIARRIRELGVYSEIIIIKELN